MTINPQFKGHDQFDVLMGSVTSHFTTIDSVLLKNECVNGGYNLRTSASYAQNCPVESPGFTRVCISSNGTNCSDLENSYITAELEITIKADKEVGARYKYDATAKNKYSPVTNKYFVGFKQSLDALSRYSIYVNSQHLYTQNFVGQESFVQYAGLNDTILQNNPYVYTTYANASTLSPNVCGTYIDLTDTDEHKITISIKINLHQILLLSPIKYLPSFCGKWEIELYFSPQNLIYCPVNPTVYCKVPGRPEITTHIETQLSEYDTETDSADDGVLISGEPIGFSNYFTQINNPSYSIKKADIDVTNETQTTPVWEGKFEYERFTLSHDKCTCNNCLANITHFQLQYEVFAALMKHYTEHPLVIPCNLLQYQRFIQNSNGSADSIQSSANLSFENLDSIFILLPRSTNSTTCYYQPYLSGCRVTLGEFGVRPQQYVKTYNDPRFIGLVLDALNLEASQISAMNKDFSNSILVANYTNTDGTKSYLFSSKYQHMYDKSSFMIGLSCSQVGFQSGTISSSNNQVNVQFDATKDNIPIITYNGDNVKFDSSAPLVAMLLLDSALLIQVVPNSDQPVVKLTSKTVV